MGGKRWVRWVIRWSVAAALAVATFFVGWWVGDGLLHHDEAISLTIPSVIAGIVMVIAGWWASLEPKGKDSDVEDKNSDTAPGEVPADNGWTVEQDVNTVGDAYVAGRYQGGADQAPVDTAPENVRQVVKSSQDAYVAAGDLDGPGGDTGGGKVVQKVESDRDAFVAGRHLRINRPKDN